MQHSILVVDDEKDILDSLERQFRKNYRIFKASSGKEALKILKNEDIHLILCDQRMPEMTGVQVFEQAQTIKPDALRILLTGYTDVESVIAAINTGQIYRYITKPWDPQDLSVTVNKALETYDLKVDLKEKNKKLEAALAELQVLDEAKSHFMILIGHELKTPLTTISSFIELLKTENLDESTSKYVNRISQGVDRLHSLVFDVLDLMGAETGQMVSTPGSFKVVKLVNEVAATFDADIKKRSVKLRVEETNADVYCDKIIIQKVLKKIIDNAIKFATASTEIIVHFEDMRDHVAIAISNMGPTISEDKIDMVLKPFTLDENIMHHTQGVGLGLAVSQSLLKTHHSKLEIQSEAGLTTVSFALSKK